LSDRLLFQVVKYNLQHGSFLQVPLSMAVRLPGWHIISCGEAYPSTGTGITSSEGGIVPFFKGADNIPIPKEGSPLTGYSALSISSVGPMFPTLEHPGDNRFTWTAPEMFPQNLQLSQGFLLGGN